MPFASQPTAQPLTRRGKRALAVIGGILAVVVAGVISWAAVNPGGYGSSRAGCVSVTAPSTTGGGVVHACGAPAKAMCRSAFAHTDKLSLLTRPQCRLAGLHP